MTKNSETFHKGGCTCWGSGWSTWNQPQGGCPRPTPAMWPGPLSVFSPDMRTQSSVQLTSGIKWKNALRMPSAGEVLGRCPGYVTGFPADSIKTGASECLPCAPSNPRLSSGLREGVGSRARTSPGCQGARGWPRWARGCFRSCKKLLTEITSSGSMQVEGRLTYKLSFLKLTYLF